MINFYDIKVLREINNRNYNIKKVGQYNLHKILNVTKKIAKQRIDNLTRAGLIDLSEGRDKKICFNQTGKGKVILKYTSLIEKKAEKIIKDLEREMNVKLNSEQERKQTSELISCLTKNFNFI